MLIDVIPFSAEPAQRGGEQSWRFPPARFPVEVAPGIQWAGVRPEIATAVVRATRFRAPFPRDVSMSVRVLARPRWRRRNRWASASLSASTAAWLLTKSGSKMEDLIGRR